LKVNDYLFWMVEMIRPWFWAFNLLCLSDLAAAEPLRSEQSIIAGPACLYDSKSYSDGALICVQKFLLLNCASDGTTATWKTVTASDLVERCVRPIALAYPPLLRPHAHRKYLARHGREPPRVASAKCFGFNGKQYCE
jgi:hypothetical protein